MNLGIFGGAVDTSRGVMIEGVIIAGKTKLKGGIIIGGSKFITRGGSVKGNNNCSLGDSTSIGVDEFLCSIEVLEYIILHFERYIIIISAFSSKGSSFVKWHNKLYCNVSIVTLSPFSILVKC